MGMAAAVRSALSRGGFRLDNAEAGRAAAIASIAY